MNWKEDYIENILKNEYKDWISHIDYHLKEKHK
jgi:hypothetical protein